MHEPSYQPVGGSTSVHAQRLQPQSSRHLTGIFLLIDAIWHAEVTSNNGAEPLDYFPIWRGVAENPISHFTQRQLGGFLGVQSAEDGNLLVRVYKAEHVFGFRWPTVWVRFRMCPLVSRMGSQELHVCIAAVLVRLRRVFPCPPLTLLLALFSPLVGCAAVCAMLSEDHATDRYERSYKCGN
jgi:hypothetical protein